MTYRLTPGKVSLVKVAGVGAKPLAGPAIPVIVIPAGTVVPVLGDVLTVVQVTDADLAAGVKVQGGPPIPVIVDTSGKAPEGGAAIKVYVVQGSLNPVDPAAYINKLLALNPIALWPLSELSGTTIVDVSGNGRNGSYRNTTGTLVGVTLGNLGIGNGGTSVGFDGSSGFGNIYSASFDAAYTGGEFSIIGWGKPRNVGVWTDATSRTLIRIRRSGSADRIDIVRSTINNELDVVYVASAVTKSVGITGLSFANFFHIAVTVTASGDQMKVYVNGVQFGSTRTGLGAWAGTLDSTQCCLGSVSTVGNTVWDGTQAVWGVFNRALSAAEVASTVVVS